METLVTYSLGAGTVLLIMGVVVVVRLVAQVKTIKINLQDVESLINNNDQLTNRRIDQEIDRVDQIYKECISYTDSRVDKLEAKCLNDLGARQVLKG
jgi:hypothetical protein